MIALLAPLRALRFWLATSWVRSTFVLAIACTLSALSVSYYATRMRGAYAEQQAIQRARDGLLDERGRLLLERSAFSSFSHVESVAGVQMQMHVPNANETRLVLP